MTGDLAAVFKALADETRLNMLALLLRYGELCVCDLQQVLGINQSKTSRHLQYLKRAGLLTDRRVGLWVRYRVPAQLDPARRALVTALRRLLTGSGTAALEESFQRWSRRKAAEGPPCRARPVARPRAAHRGGR